jgi:hypothetical protein
VYAHETHAHELIVEEPEMKSVIKGELMKELEDIFYESPCQRTSNGNVAPASTGDVKRIVAEGAADEGVPWCTEPTMLVPRPFMLTFLTDVHEALVAHVCRWRSQV